MEISYKRRSRLFHRNEMFKSRKSKFLSSCCNLKFVVIIPRRLQGEVHIYWKLQLNLLEAPARRLQKRRLPRRLQLNLLEASRDKFRPHYNNWLLLSCLLSCELLLPKSRGPSLAKSPPEPSRCVNPRLVEVS